MRLAADKKGGKAKGKPTPEDKGKDKIVRRELNKVYTNGTLVDAELLTDDQAGHCVSIREAEGEDGRDRQSFGVCVLDSATSEFNLSAFEDDVCRTKLETLMRQLRPKEIIFTKVGRPFYVQNHSDRLCRGTCPCPPRICSRPSSRAAVSGQTLVHIEVRGRTWATANMADFICRCWSTMREQKTGLSSSCFRVASRRQVCCRGSSESDVLT